jgi:hypothetical protein
VGRAYFIFWADDDNHRGRIDGEWGYDQADHGGGHWGGFQLHNRRPRALEEGQSGGSEGSSGSESSGGSSSGGSSSGGGGI